MSKIFISVVISSFKEALKLSKKLLSIQGNFDLEGPAIVASLVSITKVFCSYWWNETFTNTLSVLLLVVPPLLASCGRHFQTNRVRFERFNLFLCWGISKVESKDLVKRKCSLTDFRKCKRLSPSACEAHRIYTLLASFDHDYILNFPRTISHFLFFFGTKFITIPNLRRHFVKFRDTAILI